MRMYNIEQWQLTLYFDGEYPLCSREIKILSRRPIEARLLFFDISRDDFDAKALGFTLEQMQSSLHASFTAGRGVTGLDASLWRWRAAGLGMWATPLTWRAIRPLFAVGYSLFCRLRPYRASKAALNMLIKTAAIELARTCPKSRLLSLHPGIVISGLSRPFRGAAAARPASLAAHELLSLIDRLGPADSGNFFAYDGERLPW